MGSTDISKNDLCLLNIYHSLGFHVINTGVIRECDNSIFNVKL
jgi:hypothetical protein